MKIIKKAIDFIMEVKRELSKVSWSSRQELIGSTRVVFAITFIMAIFIGLVDILLSRILRLMFR